MKEHENMSLTDEAVELRRQIAQMEEQARTLQEKQFMYEQILDSTRDLIMVKDRQSRMIYSNQALCDLYGLTKEELFERASVPSEYDPQYKADDAYVIETGNTLVIRELPSRRHDGAILLFDTIKTPVLDAAGKVTSVVAVCRDVTEKILAEEDRKHAENALHDAERLFRKMAESMRDVFWMGTPDLSEILYVNPAYEDMWGRSLEDLMADPLDFLKAILPADLPEFMRKMEAMLQARDGNFSHEFRVTRCGSMAWLWGRVFPILDDDGTVVRICGITHDITQRKEVERRINEFNSVVSHELRTPLTSIRAALGLIEGGQTGTIGDSTKDLIDIALLECDHMIRLINDLLEIKKMEADNLELTVEMLMPAELVAAAMSGNLAAAAKHRISLRADVHCRHPVVGDRARIMQVLNNLLANAIMLGPEDSEVILSVDASESGEVRFAVCDAGPGIAKNQQSKLFMAFQQIESFEHRSKAGSGLGLAISKTIIDRHGGVIGVHSEPGVGSSRVDLQACKLEYSIVSPK